MRYDLIIRIVVKMLLPFMLLFAIYVQFHGEVGPGGGFQAGVIAAGMVILYALVFGLEAAKQVAPQAAVERIVPIGVLIYLCTGFAGVMTGRNFLDYSGLGPDSPHGHEYGIMIVEIGVVLTVSSTMVAIFYAFLDRGR